MFTGIIRHHGHVANSTETASEAEVHIQVPAPIYSQSEVGDSIAINGCCLTVTSKRPDHTVTFTLATETLNRTAPILIGDAVHIEPALRLGEQIGGHFVTGHIDGCVHVVDYTPTGTGAYATFRLPGDLEPGLVTPQGSVTLAGVSLTVASCTATEFTVQFIPHTLEVTLLNAEHLLVPDTPINLEVDCLARYARGADLAVLESFTHTND